MCLRPIWLSGSRNLGDAHWSACPVNMNVRRFITIIGARISNNILNTSFTLSYLVVLSVCVGCGREGDRSGKNGKSHNPQVVVQDDDSTNSVQIDAENLFERFSEALKAHDPTSAELFVALKHRERFRKGYKFWRGARFYDVEVIEGSPKSEILRVRVSFQLPSGRIDREVKQLIREAGRWVLHLTVLRLAGP